MKHLLVVDDDATHRLSLQALLIEEGYGCETAENCGEAIAVLNEKQIDLVLTDHDLPNMNGIQLIKRIHQRDLLFHPPSILITGQLAHTIPKMAQEAGAFATVRKPYKIPDLFALIAEALKIL